MYKVFIENRALHLVDEKDLIPSDAIIIYEGHLDLLKKSLFSLLEAENMDLPIFLVSPFPEMTFSKLFGDYVFVEAAGGIVKRKDSFLFIKRNGFWDIPKGKLDADEKPEDAAVREIEEECGITGPVIDGFIGLTYHTYLYNGTPTIKKTYWYSLVYDGPKVLKGQIEEGITQVKWFKESELHKIRKNTFASIEEVMDQYF